MPDRFVGVDVHVESATALERKFFFFADSGLLLTVFGAHGSNLVANPVAGEVLLEAAARKCLP
jgi:hypothetical protein